MKSSTLLTAAILIPLTACFEPTIPYDPPAAELEQGEWLFAMDAVSVQGDCYGMGVDDADDFGEVVAWAWVETDGERGVSIDLEGVLLEGEIWGESLQADGYVDMDYGYETEPGEPGTAVPMEDDETDADSDDDDDGVSSGDSDGPTLICDPDPEPYQEQIYVSMDADILAADHMQGSIVVEYVYFDTYCSIELEFDAEALGDDPCDCDCDDDAPTVQGSGSSEGSDREDSGDEGDEIVVLPA
jgi:hypothetical protein